jgi:hypothetical protein
MDEETKALLLITAGILRGLAASGRVTEHQVGLCREYADKLILAATTTPTPPAAEAP